MRHYEEMLDEDLEWALNEGSKHFDETSAVHVAMRRIAKRLDELGISYAVVGGMAMFIHGFRRFTEDVDLLVTPEGLKNLHRELEGLGYVPPFKDSKDLRDAENGVRIEFLVTGQFPGDGKPKPVAFPDPDVVAVAKKGIKLLSIQSLVELKLASGMMGVSRFKDIADVVELIRALHLPEDLAAQLNPYVREKYLELWRGLRDSPPGPVAP